MSCDYKEVDRDDNGVGILHGQAPGEPRPPNSEEITPPLVLSNSTNTVIRLVGNRGIIHTGSLHSSHLLLYPSLWLLVPGLSGHFCHFFFKTLAFELSSIVTRKWLPDFVCFRKPWFTAFKSLFDVASSRAYLTIVVQHDWYWTTDTAVVLSHQVIVYYCPFCPSENIIIIINHYNNYNG